MGKRMGTPDQQTKDVLAYLNAENDYRDTVGCLIPKTFRKNCTMKLWADQTNRHVLCLTNTMVIITSHDLKKERIMPLNPEKNQSPEEIIVDEMKGKGPKILCRQRIQ